MQIFKILLLCLFTTNCANLIMQLPQELTDGGKEARVSSFTGFFDNKPIIFKPFIATNVQIESVKSNTGKTPLELSNLPNAEAQQNFSFKLSSENTQVESNTHCLVQDKLVIHFVAKQEKRRIERIVNCEITVGDQKYELHLQSDKKGLSGFLIYEMEKIELEATYSFDEIRKGLVLGYIFKNNKILAAVTLRDDFSFWYQIKNSDLLNSALASASASLMIITKRGNILK